MSTRAVVARPAPTEAGCTAGTKRNSVQTVPAELDSTSSRMLTMQPAPPMVAAETGTSIDSGWTSSTLAKTTSSDLSDAARASSSLAPSDRDETSETCAGVSTLEVAEQKKAKATRSPLHLLTLPPELQLMILQQLDFADIVRLRRSCKQLRALACPSQMRIIWGPMQLQTQLLGHCKNCLTYDQTRSTLLLSSPTDPDYPLASRCVKCAMADGDSRICVGKKINLANFDTVWVCRWCGWPVSDAAVGNDQFHRECYKRYNKALFRFFLLGWIQLSLGITGAALAWRYFRRALLVFAPTVASFLLLWICLGILIVRGNRRRTYHLTLLLELSILGLWIPPVYYIASAIARSPDESVPKSTVAALAIFALNMVFRLLNLLGNFVLFFEYNMTKRYSPRASVWRKAVHPITSRLVFWTYPQALDQKYPPV